MLGHSKIDCLKMDIEGVEYDVIEQILESKVDIVQFAIELHQHFFLNGKQKSQKLISTLNKRGYKIFAISDSYHEISFIKESVLLPS